ncbi:GntR family transcriptional regulator [Paenibacillus thalictri]|uniref:GntR family transcriptional regulator n=2 Tax=Paenibacillus thalictri TaxID=2527873 RepID=A0A4V2J3L9_9BACL|nr:GntR family transcriptional regulator [Paenibacillus thalictri]
MEKLDSNNPVPLYHQLKNILLQKIVDKVWRPEELIPTEKELIEQYGVSRTTVREAITELVNEGFLVKKQGKGTTVTSHHMEARLSRLSGLAEEIMEQGLVPSAKLISAEFKKDRFYELSQLQLPDGAVVYIIERVRFANGEPIAYEITCWPERIGKLLELEDLNTAHFYKVLEEKHNISLKGADETIHAINSMTYEAGLLGVSPGAALLEMRRVSYDKNGEPIEYTRTKYRSDRYAYKIHLER